jgi:hypothetical protein
VVYLVHTLSKSSILEGIILEFKKCFWHFHFHSADINLG